ncbi:MAG: pyridoxamine 5'-phosphate oxidase family protein [Nanoarchaeota archaeon]|nr:pyridoxamine 5'-phosphate oxidase family protein [Nanoarchaeota archaeon]MBU1321192.1 pyridoxamine 5'-phosphate oxidase family protein [Nanoarchaeota archaeon]MBU1598460.1 pyridoxamine 5'-phosphate oxidase family protein [Nanoarchaeota archaeon]MBU2441393.1 pyridoxamine 5'-phosphate oxidase family protein [Nanoarchaeota archaeon]
MIEISSELKKLIEGNVLAFATVDETGNPHCIAVGDVKVISSNQILVGDNYMAETIRNINKNNNVALVVWNKEWEKEGIGFELKGTVEIFKKGKWIEKVKEIHKGFPAKCAILITVNKIKKLA